ncbi:hypothetical protein BD779DRAFT_389013 [Infundibulicybe gibba]|nr:hypothetical protein BD779DRAFT_389013 [Infundibulicybe gibba]
MPHLKLGKAAIPTHQLYKSHPTRSVLPSNWRSDKYTPVSYFVLPGNSNINSLSSMWMVLSKMPCPICPRHSEPRPDRRISPSLLPPRSLHVNMRPRCYGNPLSHPIPNFQRPHYHHRPSLPHKFIVDHEDAFSFMNRIHPVGSKPHNDDGSTSIISADNNDTTLAWVGKLSTNSTILLSPARILAMAASSRSSSASRRIYQRSKSLFIVIVYLSVYTARDHQLP